MKDEFLFRLVSHTVLLGNECFVTSSFLLNKLAHIFNACITGQCSTNGFLFYLL